MAGATLGAWTREVAVPQVVAVGAATLGAVKQAVALQVAASPAVALQGLRALVQ